MNGCECEGSTWVSMREGRLSARRLASQGDYVLIPNAQRHWAKRALDPLEVQAVQRLARGLMAKQVAAELALAPSTLSRVLAGAVAKLGFASTPDMLSAVGGLVFPHQKGLEADLTQAEREVLQWVQAGLTNREIGARRCTSERTVANQVAALLRKTRLASRYALAARVGGGRRLLAPEGVGATEAAA